MDGKLKNKSYGVHKCLKEIPTSIPSRTILNCTGILCPIKRTPRYIFQFCNWEGSIQATGKLWSYILIK